MVFLSYFKMSSKSNNPDPSKSIQLTANLVPILVSAGLTPATHPLLGLNRLHQSLLLASFPDPVTQAHLDETIRTATMNVNGLSSILAPGHPITGIAVTELGRLLAVDEPEPAEQTQQTYPPSGPPRLKLAYETLVRARQTLMIGFGVTNEGGAVGKEVREQLVSLEKEMGVWKEGVKNVIQDQRAR